jgi:predicted esterase
MLNRLPSKTSALLLIFGLAFSNNHVQGQCGPYTSLKHNRTQFQNPAGTPITVGTYFTGTLEWLPEGYDPTGTTTYPVFIYLHGQLAVGNGSPEQLCRLFTDQDQSLPSQLENGVWPATITPGGGTGTPMKYIVLSPQYNNYDFDHSAYPQGDHVEELITYLLTKYKINPNRIYLTGMSAGANIVMEYAGSSLERAQRVAAVSAASLCAPLLPNNESGGENIANAMLPVWMVHCETDDPCKIERPAGWDSAINVNEPVNNPNNPVFTRLNNANSNTQLQCHGFAHDTWSRLYSPTFEPNGVNLFEWSLAFTNSTLPVTLKSFDANISNGKVHLKWITTTERDNAAFTIERSADGLSFEAIGSVKGSGNSSIERSYAYTDNAPLNNMSYYRLLQSDNSGPHEYSMIRKVFNRTANSKRVIVSPNPITTQLSAFIQLDKKQRVLITLTDMNGRRVAQINNFFDEGNTEFTIPTGNLNKGIYLLKVSGETISETQKVIRQ